MLRHRAILCSCGYDQLFSMDPRCSFMPITPVEFTWHLFAYCVAMIVTFVIHMLDLPCIFLEITCTWICMSPSVSFSKLFYLGSLSERITSTSIHQRYIRYTRHRYFHRGNHKGENPTNFLRIVMSQR